MPLLISDEDPTGHAVIQVSAENGNNAILIYGGANQRISQEEML